MEEAVCPQGAAITGAGLCKTQQRMGQEDRRLGYHLLTCLNNTVPVLIQEPAPGSVGPPGYNYLGDLVSLPLCGNSVSP